MDIGNLKIIILFIKAMKTKMKLFCISNRTSLFISGKDTLMIFLIPRRLKVKGGQGLHETITN